MLYIVVPLLSLEMSTAPIYPSVGALYEDNIAVDIIIIREKKKGLEKIKSANTNMERIIKMSFQNSRNIAPPVRARNVPVPASVPVRAPALTLRSSMIERIHTSKPGCSACGRKVA